MMDLGTYLEIMLNDCANPCCISDLETDRFVFMNTAMKKLLHITEDIKGKFCYEIMQGSSDRCVFCPNEILEFGKFHENYVFNHKVSQYFRVNHTLLEYENKQYNMCKYFVAPSFGQQQFGFEDAMKRCAKIFKEDESVQVQLFLELLGKFYNSEKVYIYHFREENMTITCEALWTKGESVVVFPDLSQKMDTAKILEWFSRRNEVGILEANRLLKNYETDSLEAEILSAFQLENVVLCDLADVRKSPEFMVGLSNRKEVEFDYRLLKAVAQLIHRVGDVDAMDEMYHHITDYDFLTGFYSRTRYSKKVEELIVHCPLQLGVVFVNINGLQKTNEFLGSAQGDSQICKVANMLRDYFSEDFYRVSGDEFVAFFHDMSEYDFNDLVNAFRLQLYQKGDYTFAMGHSFQSGRFDVQQLVSDSSTMMYINKQNYYHSIRKESNPAENVLLNKLFQYLNNEEFLVYLQPQVNLNTNELVGAEALIRRIDKRNQKMVFPDQFIPLYEKESIIRHVDLFVVEKVCEMLSKWKEVGKEIPISVNLSRVTLLEFGIVNIIAEICDRYQVGHGLVIIEVTERVGLIESDVASSLISEFMAQGFKISLDDFGCAYSNIVTLVKVAVNEVKIDKSLVDNLIVSEKNQIIVGNMLNMCNSFQNTHTLAEGIENESQAEILRDYGCSYGQGYLYSRPIPEEEFFEKYIAK